MWDTGYDAWQALAGQERVRQMSGEFPGMPTVKRRAPGEKPAGAYIAPVDGGYLLEDCVVTDTQYEGRNARIEALRVGDPVQVEISASDAGKLEVRNAAGASLGLLGGVEAMQLLPILRDKFGRIENAKVSYVVPLSQRGPRAKKAELYIRMDLLQAEAPKPEGGAGCVVYRMGGDQTRVWVQSLRVMYCDIPCEEAKLLFEVYNRMNDEYGGKTDTGYAGLDNLAEEIKAARAKMAAEMRPGLSYAPPASGTYDFGEALRELAAQDARYAPVARYAAQGNDLMAIFQRNCRRENAYFWRDQTRTDEVISAGDGYNHWYDVAELMDPAALTFDPDDEEMVSIFGFNRFLAFADLSYGC